MFTAYGYAVEASTCKQRPTVDSALYICQFTYKMLHEKNKQICHPVVVIHLPHSLEKLTFIYYSQYLAQPVHLVQF